MKYKTYNKNVIVELVEEMSDGYEETDLHDDTVYDPDNYLGVREAKKTKSGIVLVKTAESKVGRMLSTGKVVAIGEQEPQCKVGDVLYFYQDMSIPLNLVEGKSWFLLKEDNIICGMID